MSELTDERLELLITKNKDEGNYFEYSALCELATLRAKVKRLETIEQVAKVLYKFREVPRSINSTYIVRKEDMVALSAALRSLESGEGVGD